MRGLTVLAAMVIAITARAQLYDYRAEARTHPRGRQFQWNIPKVISSVPVTGEQMALGVPLHLTAVRSELPATKLVEFIIGEFKQSDLWIPPANAQFQIEGGASITGFDTERLISYTAIFQPNPDDTTTVILGEANLGRRVVNRPPRDLPVMPAARHLLTSSGEGSLVMSYEVKATRDEAVSFYRSALHAAGYAEREGQFVRGAQALKISADEGHEPGVLFVSIEARGVAGPAPAPAETTARAAPDAGTR